MSLKEPRRWNLHPNEFESPRGWLIRQWRTFTNFLHAAFHPNLTKPWTLKKYFHVMAVTHRCMKAFRSNHKLLRANLGKADVAAFGLQRWQDDPNWEVKIKKEEDGKAPRDEPNDEDDRCDSDPPKRR